MRKMLLNHTIAFVFAFICCFVGHIDAQGLYAGPYEPPETNTELAYSPYDVNRRPELRNSRIYPFDDGGYQPLSGIVRRDTQPQIEVEQPAEVPQAVLPQVFDYQFSGVRTKELLMKERIRPMPVHALLRKEILEEDPEKFAEM